MDAFDLQPLLSRLWSQPIQGIAEGTSPVPNFYDGLRCQQVQDAVRQSGGSGRWVDIPVDIPQE